MNLRILIAMVAALMLLGVAANLDNGSSSDTPSPTIMTSGFVGDGGSLMQEGSDETPSDEEPSDEIPETPLGGMSDVTVRPDAEAEQRLQRLQDALAGIRDYEVQYDTSLTHAENTPPELRELGVTYAGEESPVAQRSEALNRLDLVDVLADRYEVVEDQYAADPEEDFAEDDPDRTLNYYQPRGDPFIIPDLIPDELRPELAGTGLDGAVDPEVLEQLYRAQYEANLRTIPIAVIGVIQTGPYRGVMYTIWGTGRTDYLEQGESRCWRWGGGYFKLSPSQISEDYVVLRLVGAYDRRCRYEATNPVYRTFNIPR